MAGNKINTKTKGKDEKVKGKQNVQLNEDIEDNIDFAVLRKPIPTSVTGLAQARKIFDVATEELKELLSNECDILYECKVCRNIFRSLANFISHKRVYCKDKFSSTEHGHFVKATCTDSEISQIKRTEVGYQESLKNPETKDDDENDDRIPLTRDLTAVYEKIMKTKSVFINKDDPPVVLKKIPSSNAAMFQNLDLEQDQKDDIRSEVNEIDSILSRDLAVLQSDGKFVIESSKDSEQLREFESIIQISDDEDMEDYDSLKCKLCDLQFSTQKTLKFHMKYKHHESRLVYPCPDCLEIFSTSWSVYRHLFKVHRKTAAQIRRLRESIQAKAFKMNNPPAFYEKRKNIMKASAAQKITDEERLEQENQAWMDGMEGDGEVPRCGGCGRGFERRAALQAHTVTCPPRSKARAKRKIEIQIRKDYNKGSAFGLTIARPPDFKIPSEDSQTNKQENNNEMEPEIEDKDTDDMPMDYDDEEQKSNESEESPEKNENLKQYDQVKPVIRLPHALQAEKSNLAAFKQKIYSEIDMVKLTCKKCNSKHSSVLELYEHMADHLKWVRYACKLCNFKNYKFEKLPEHVKEVHKLKGDFDFYYSTVKAIDGTEAMIHSSWTAESESADDANDPNETSPSSRRPSRCSSDSSRLSDDSSSSNTIKDISVRKRKMHQYKVPAKKKREDDEEDQKDGEVSVAKALKAIILGENNSTIRNVEENSSDMDEVEDKGRRQGMADTNNVPRRPVRKRTKVKNEDFEYDLSNILKKEAQGYKDSQTVKVNQVAPVKTNASITTPKTSVSTTTPKTSSTPTTPKSNAATVSPGASTTTTVSKPNQTIAASKTYPPATTVKTNVTTNTTKTCPAMSTSSKYVQQRKKALMNSNNNCCGALVMMSKKSAETASAHLKTSNLGLFITRDQRPNVFVRPMVPRFTSKGDKYSPKKDIDTDSINTAYPYKIPKTEPETNNEMDPKGAQIDNTNVSTTEVVLPHKNSDQNRSDPKKPSNAKDPPVLPVKLRRQSLDLMKNPIINKNITDFTKAGMKTKILVIKPINRNGDKSRSSTTPLKFQTITLKDPSKKSSAEDKSSDQVMVVKVPKVPCASEKCIPEKNTSTANEIQNHCEAKEKDNSDNGNIVADISSKSSSNDNISNSCISDNKSNIDNVDKSSSDSVGETLDAEKLNSVADGEASKSKESDKTDSNEVTKSIEEDITINNEHEDMGERIDTEQQINTEHQINTEQQIDKTENETTSDNSDDTVVKSLITAS